MECTQSRRAHQLLCGLFDFNGYDDLVATVSQVLDLPTVEVQERLFCEAIETGWNVSRAAEALGVTAHVYNDRMERLYQETDAFVFELLVGHLLPYCKEIDGRVMEAIDSYAKRNTSLRTLCLGDGIGSDSLRFASMGHKVTYFEFDGYSSTLAVHRFRRQQLDGQIRMIFNLERIPISKFDVVVCREVLEHVPDPRAVIADIRRYLDQQGIAVITESFRRVEPSFPTHLAPNQRFDGKTERLFVEEGFRLLKSFPERRPMVFQRTGKSDQSRFGSLKPEPDSLDTEPEYVIRQMVKRIGRKLLRLIPV
mgnify:CR=1 FL=1